MTELERGSEHANPGIVQLQFCHHASIASACLPIHIIIVYSFPAVLLSVDRYLSLLSELESRP
ncbi:hypothetical protein BDW67DRAFT_139012 [Aspergillus spinulosporus]